MSEQAQWLAPNLDRATPAIADDFQTRQRWRFWLLAFGLFLLVIVVMARLVSVQLFTSAQQTNRFDVALKAQPRGTIVDRHGELLAADRFYYQLTASPDLIETDDDRMLVAQQLNALVGTPIDSVFTVLKSDEQKKWTSLADKISLDQGEALLNFQKDVAQRDDSAAILYVALEPIPVRYYPQDSLANYIVGLVNLNRESLNGVERYYDRFLRAEGNGSASNQVVAPLNSLPSDVLRFLPSVSGNDLVLTIDRGAQWIVEDELRQGMERYRAQKGTIIVMEPSTGAILAMASWPNYDPNHYSDAPYERFLDPAISEQYEPGSIFKIITMATALDTETVTPTMPFQDVGSVECGTRIIMNANRTAYGIVDVTKALALSLNVVTSQVAEKVGEANFYQYVRRFGFGSPTEIDLGGEIAGLLKTPGNEDWSQSDLCTNSFGQGIAVTPLQMVNAAAAIANGGKLMRPYVVQSRVVNGRVLTTEPTVVHQVIQEQYAKELTEMMVETVQTSNIAASVLGYKVAGKSGTAQIPGPDGYLEDQIVGSFIGFAPADDPKFVILVKIERPDFKLTQWADQNAVPIFGRVARRLFLHLNIPPDDVRLAN
ncbi:MAG: penicillin-binding protein 2 [Caldilineaceae bacterium]